MTRGQFETWVGEEEKPENARGGVVHVKSSWSGEEEVYVASGNHFSVAHRLRECVYVCRLAVFIWAVSLQRVCARLSVCARPECRLCGAHAHASGRCRAFTCACEEKKGGVNVLILVRRWAGQSSCVCAEDFSNVVGNNYGWNCSREQNSRVARPLFFFNKIYAHSQHAHSSRYFAVGPGLAAFLAPSLQMMFRCERDVHNLPQLSSCFVIPLFCACVFVFEMRPPSQPPS